MRLYLVYGMTVLIDLDIHGCSVVLVNHKDGDVSTSLREQIAGLSCSVQEPTHSPL